MTGFIIITTVGTYLVARKAQCTVSQIPVLRQTIGFPPFS